jgi:hypothetical protein
MKMIIVSFEDSIAVCKSKNEMYYTTIERNMLQGFNIGDEIDIEEISKTQQTKKVFGVDYIVFDDVIVELKR